jgi:UDP-glucose:(heptosyl)LPS alpha-1,3-glucosyltransferase
MKVAIITEQSEVSLGGAERSVFEMGSALITNGIDVTVLAAKGTSHTKWVKPLCEDVAGKRVSLSIFTGALRKHLAQNQYDVIHSILPIEFADVYQPRSGSCPAAIERNAAAYENSMVAAFKRATSFFNFRRGELAASERRLCKNQDGPVVAALSKYVAEQFRHYYGLSESRIVIVANGVKTDKSADPSEFAQIKKDILANYGGGVKPVFFLFAGHNFRRKGLRPLIKAIHIAKTCNAAAMPHLFVAGTGRIGTYQSIARRFGVEKSVSFLGKATHIQNILAISDAAVLPTFDDPASRFVLEALAMDKPVITTLYNGATDLFVDGRHGIVIDEPTNVDKLVQAILYFCDRANIQKAADAIVADNLKEKVSMDRHAKELIELYKCIIAKKAGR